MKLMPLPMARTLSVCPLVKALLVTVFSTKESEPSRLSSNLSASKFASQFAISPVKVTTGAGRGLEVGGWVELSHEVKPKSPNNTVSIVNKRVTSLFFIKYTSRMK